MRWEDVAIGRDVGPHDVAIAAFSLGFYDLAAVLRKLDAAARRSVYLFWHAGEWRSHEEMALYRAVFGEGGALRKGYLESTMRSGTRSTTPPTGPPGTGWRCTIPIRKTSPPS